MPGMFRVSTAVPTLALCVCLLTGESLAGQSAGEEGEELPPPYPRVELGGRLMLDAARYREDQVPLKNDWEVRRARFELDGNVSEDWRFALSFEFAPGFPDMLDANLSYRAWDRGWLTLGQLRAPFSLEEVASSKYVTFMERALPNLFALGYRLGVGASAYGDRWTLAGALVGDSIGDPSKGLRDEGHAASGRATYLAWRDGGSLAHLGGSLAYQDLSALDSFRLRARPESHVTDVRYIDTGELEDVDDQWSWGLEAAAVKGPFSVQGEYIRSTLDVDDRSLQFSGWYLYGSWFLTGESRPYNEKNGAFGRVKPFSKWGGLELAVRYSHADLTDGPVLGGEEDILTFGLNWYIKRNLRLMLNYLRIRNDDNADGDGDLPGGDRPHALQARFQVDF